MVIDDFVGKESPEIAFILPEPGPSGLPLYGVMRFYSKQAINGDFSKRGHYVLTIYDLDSPVRDRNLNNPRQFKDVVGIAIKENRIIAYDKKIRDLQPVIAKDLDLGNITESSLKKSILAFEGKVKDFKENNKTNYSRRDSSEGLTKEEARAQAQAYTRLKAENAAQAGAVQVTHNL